MKQTRFFCLLALACFSAAIATIAQPERALSPGSRPEDARLGPLTDLDGYFPFSPPATPDEWRQRAAQLRLQTLVSLGLWPLPEKTPLKAVIHGKMDRGNYTVEKVYFESYPGFFVTGNLYRPKGRAEKLPAVLSPHGHWDDGRFMDFGVDETRKMIQSGAERFEEGGRSPLQSRCVQLARMGCVVFHYDMIGYADSVQIPQSIAHGFAKQRPEMNTAENWGLFSPQAEAHLQSVMGLQTWNSIRALDFLCSLPDVDTNRIGVTGASGGGTQTFILGAVDDRPAVAFPAVMVSTAMQGGCTCENACLLRIGAGNVDFAALFAPKPLGMTAANDWTREMPTKGFPDLQSLYAMLGAGDHVMLKPLLQFPHNYNAPSRAAMYGWFKTHLHLPSTVSTEERDYKRLSRAELSVWDVAHRPPSGGPDFERKLLRQMTRRSDQQIEALSQQPDAYRKVVGAAMSILFAPTVPPSCDTVYREITRTNFAFYHQTTGLLLCDAPKNRLPMTVLIPNTPTNRVALWLNTRGKAGLFESDRPANEVRKLLENGVTVVGPDLFMQGEFTEDGIPPVKTRVVNNPREAAAYTLGYNRSLFAQRVGDVLWIAGWLKDRDPGSDLWLVALDDSGRWAAAALAGLKGKITAAALNTGHFRFGRVLDLQAPDFMPGGAKYGDLPGMLALGSPTRLWIKGEGGTEESILKTLYRLDAKEDRLFLAPESAPAMDAVDWLLK
jgi:hypothetical protein